MCEVRCFPMSATQKSVEGSIDSKNAGSTVGLFNDDGSIIDADELVAREAGSPPSSVEEWFEAAGHEEVLKNIKVNHEALGFKMSALVERHIRKITKMAAERGESVPPLPVSIAFDITDEQSGHEPFDEKVKTDEGKFDTEVHCGVCDEMVDATKMVLQTRAADESGTIITLTKCGHNSRHND